MSTGGPALALLGFLLLPLVWSVPEALVTAELATAFPEDSGYVAWVTAAFGPFWGFQEGWWSWLSGVTDNSVYPVLLLSYVDAVLPGTLPYPCASVRAACLCCCRCTWTPCCPARPLHVHVHAPACACCQSMRCDQARSHFRHREESVW